MPATDNIRVMILDGRRNYREIWDLQKRFNTEVQQGIRPDTIIFVEHNPVYTIGFHGDEHNLLVGSEQLDAKNVELIRIERGGDITFHGPGQLVVYFIVNLVRKDYGIRSMVERLQHAVVDTCAEFGVTAHGSEEAPGVWIDDERGLRKICAMGLKVKQGVTMHGIALNVDTDLSWFNAINPCGFKNGMVTSLKNEITTAGAPKLPEVIPPLKRNLLRYL